MSGENQQQQPETHLHIVLVAPEIHWNTGNVGRTCLALGAQLHLVRPLGFSLEDRYVRRAGLDYWERVVPRLWDSWEAFDAALPELGTPYLFSSEGTQTHWDVRYARPAVLVLGSESVGLPRPLLQRRPESVVRLPMRAGSVRSLNLSTAAAVAGYEVLRQWRHDESARNLAL